MAEGEQHDAARRSKGKEMVVSPGGRPLDYQGSDGWASRIISRTLTAGGVGAGAGFLVGAARGQPPLRLGASVGANFLLVASCFCGAQELTRELRASDPDDWVNSVLGGLASGAVLAHLQGGRARALPFAISLAGVGTGLQLGVIQFREYRLRHFLNTLPAEPIKGEFVPHVEAALSEREIIHKDTWKLPDWFPIQILGAEEAAKRALEKEQKLRNTVESLHSSGELPLTDQRPQ